MISVESYVARVVKRGDQGSKLLNALTAPTLRNNNFVRVVGSGMGGLAALEVPEDQLVLVSSGFGGNAAGRESHAKGLIEVMAAEARKLGAQPVAISNIIDSRDGDDKLLREVASHLVRAANKNKVAILNGENAILGERLNVEALTSGTMISFLPKNSRVARSQNVTEFYLENRPGAGPTSAVFDPNGSKVIVNSDGVGTKTELYERSGSWGYATLDLMAMNLDDASKFGAKPKVFAATMETNLLDGFIIVSDALRRECDKIGLPSLLRPRVVGDNVINGIRTDSPAFNLNASVVSTISEERLENPLRPREGEYLISISGEPNPRSNGISSKRRLMEKRFGKMWHNTPEGEIFLKFLASPSTLLYPVFRELDERNLASSFYHMSGGAYEGKLARPLAKQGLFCRVTNLFEPDWRESALAGFGLMPAEVAYAQWPMGNDGFFTTTQSDSAVAFVRSRALKTKIVGRLERAKRGRTGIELAEIMGSDGKPVYFSGRN